MKIDTSGPAFPFIEPVTECSVAPGMTLRDYFASQAMIAIPRLSGGCELGAKDMAHDAYLIADAMLEARER